MSCWKGRGSKRAIASRGTKLGGLALFSDLSLANVCKPHLSDFAFSSFGREMRSQLVSLSLFVVSLAVVYTVLKRKISGESSPMGGNPPSSMDQNKVDKSGKLGEGARAMPPVPEDEHVVQAGGSQRAHQPLRATPTREQMTQAALNGSGGNARIPVSPIPKE